jgi:hypothetical protein
MKFFQETLEFSPNSSFTALRLKSNFLSSSINALCNEKCKRLQVLSDDDFKIKEDFGKEDNFCMTRSCSSVKEENTQDKSSDNEKEKEKEKRNITKSLQSFNRK